MTSRKIHMPNRRILSRQIRSLKQREKLKKERESRREAQEKLDIVQESLHSSEADNSSCRGELVASKIEVTTLKAKLAGVKDENDRLAAERDRLKAQYSELLGRIQSLEVKLAASNRVVASRQAAGNNVERSCVCNSLEAESRAAHSEKMKMESNARDNVDGSAKERDVVYSIEPPSQRAMEFEPSLEEVEPWPQISQLEIENWCRVGYFQEAPKVENSIPIERNQLENVGTPEIVAQSWPSVRSNSALGSSFRGQVRSLLNKLSLNNIDRIVTQFLRLDVKDEATLKTAALDIFERALREPKFGRVYASLILKLEQATFGAPIVQPVSCTMVQGLSLFGEILNLCQNEFEKWVMPQVSRGRLGECENVLQDGNLGKRGVFNVAFVSELFLVGLIEPRTIHRHCVEPLLAFCSRDPSDRKIEAICTLLEKTGKVLSMEYDSEERVQAYLESLRRLCFSPTVTTRARFLIEDVLAKSANGWAREVKVEKRRTFGEQLDDRGMSTDFRPTIGGRENFVNKSSQDWRVASTDMDTWD